MGFSRPSMPLTIITRPCPKLSIFTSPRTANHLFSPLTAAITSSIAFFSSSVGGRSSLLRSRQSAPFWAYSAKRLALDGVRIIRQREGEKLQCRRELARLHRQHLAADRQLAGFLRQFADGQRFGGDRPPEDGLRLFLWRPLASCAATCSLCVLIISATACFVLSLAAAANPPAPSRSFTA